MHPEMLQIPSLKVRCQAENYLDSRKQAEKVRIKIKTYHFIDLFLVVMLDVVIV